MYKGLKPELEKIVDELRVGDGIIIDHKPDHWTDRTMGYVKDISGSYLTLTLTRESKLFLETLAQMWGRLDHHHYDSFENIRVVDPKN